MTLGDTGPQKNCEAIHSTGSAGALAGAAVPSYAGEDAGAPSRGAPSRATGISGFSALATLVLLLLLCVQAFGALSATDFEAANRLYDQGKFAEAATAYEKLLQTGHASSALYFNMGNAFFKSSQVGRAIAAYRRAEQLTPGDPDLRANLQFARNQVQGPTLAPAFWQRWLGRLTLNQWTCLAAVAVWIWFLLLSLRQWRPRLASALRSYLLIVGMAGAVLCACFALAFYQNQYARLAFVVTREVSIRQGPDDQSPARFTAHDGAELRVLDQKDNWLQVSTDTQHFGWIRRDQVQLSS